MSSSWRVRLQIIDEDDVRSVDLAASASSRATAGAKAVAHARSNGWKVLAIEDVQPATIAHRNSGDPTQVLEAPITPGKLLQFPTPSGKPN